MTHNRRLTALSALILFIALLVPFQSSAQLHSNSCFTTVQGQTRQLSAELYSGINEVIIACNVPDTRILSFNSQAITHLSRPQLNEVMPQQVSSHEYAFKVPAGASQFTLNINSDFAFTLSFKLSSPENYNKYEQLHNAVMYSFLSFCLALALYVLILGRSLHSSYFYTYAAYITVTALFFASQERIFTLFLDQDSWLLHYKFATILAGSSLFIGQLFISGLLDFNKNIPQPLYKTIKWLARGLFALSISALIVPIVAAKPVQLAMGYITLILMFSMLIGMLIAFKKRIHCSGLVLISSVVMLVAMVARILFTEHSEFLARYALVMAIMLDAFILSFAISEKVKLLYVEKVKAMEKANLDPLTGIYNKRGWYREIPTHLKQLSKKGGAIVLLYIDMDKFKSINDRYGHDVGDKALIHLTNVLNHQTGGSDVIGRVGGDEFVVLAYFENAEHALPFISRISERLTEMEINTTENNVKFSASLGHQIITDPIESIEQAMHETDCKMYKAKAAKTS